MHVICIHLWYLHPWVAVWNVYKNPCALCWIHWLFDIVIHRVLEHSGMLRFRKLRAHPGSPGSREWSDEHVALAPLQNMGRILSLVGHGWAVFLPDLLKTGFQQQLVVSCWFAWTVDVGLPGASYGSTQAKGSDTFQVDVSCVGLAVDARFVGMSLRDAHSMSSLGAIWERCSAPSQIRIHLEPTMGQLQQPPITSRSIFPFCSCPATNKE